MSFAKDALRVVLLSVAFSLVWGSLNFYLHYCKILFMSALDLTGKETYEIKKIYINFQK
jgi:hypothetical protein